MKILYGLYNREPDIWCERVFMPDTDMERLMRENGIKLFGIESREPIDRFDIIGFTLQYELSYTAVLNMLDLAGLPLYSRERDSSYPLVIAGGRAFPTLSQSRTFSICLCWGREDASLELFELYRKHKAGGYDKEEFLRDAARIEGVRAVLLQRQLQGRRNNSVNNPQKRRACESQKADCGGFGQRVLSRQVCGAFYRHCPRPRDERGFPRVYPRV